MRGSAHAYHPPHHRQEREQARQHAAALFELDLPAPRSRAGGRPTPPDDETRPHPQPPAGRSLRAPALWGVVCAAILVALIAVGVDLHH
jgi:ferric-dicitrate binding protein FerR (iron transport regulator)